MVISQKYAAIAVDYTNENRIKKGVILDENYLELYKKNLRGYTENRKIAENSDLDFDIWTVVFGYDKEGANNPLNNAQPQIDSNNIISQDSIIS